MRQTTGTSLDVGDLMRMTAVSKTDRTRVRADRLRDEARNCLTVAMRQRDSDHAATLIDEAIKLARRSAELSES